MICKKCGKEISDNAQFCKYCGTQFIKTEKVNGKTIVKEMKIEEKPKNKNALISITFTFISIIGCLLPLSKFGIVAIVITILAGIISLFFRIRGKDEMYKIYDKKGILVGKRLLDIALYISIICIILAAFSITRFI